MRQPFLGAAAPEGRQPAPAAKPGGAGWGAGGGEGRQLKAGSAAIEEIVSKAKGT